MAKNWISAEMTMPAVKALDRTKAYLDHHARCRVFRYQPKKTERGRACQNMEKFNGAHRMEPKTTKDKSIS